MGSGSFCPVPHTRDSQIWLTIGLGAGIMGAALWRWNKKQRSGSRSANLESEVAAALPYYPFKGIDRFYDVQGLLNKPHLFEQMCDMLAARCAELGITKIVAFEARGFLFTPVSLKLGVPFVMLRKAGKMPNTISSTPYTKEYAGVDTMCIQRGAVGPGDKVMLIDDLVATGGTLCSGIELLKACGAEPTECACMVELKFLKGRERVIKAGAKGVWSFVDEEKLNTPAVLPKEYVDDGAAH